tara:strand:- start:1214 stop:1384 length:171 start_codon:yes stop_codon:yes gene_type:complete
MEFQKVIAIIAFTSALTAASYAVSLATVAPVERDMIHVTKQLDRIERKLDYLIPRP